MDMLRRLVHVCQVHYEKIILVLALVGLGGAVVALIQVSQNEANNLQQYEVEMKRGKGKPMEPLDSARYRAALQTAQTPPTLNFATPHNLFNPVKWQRKPDGSLIKVQTGREVGPDAMRITRIGELYFIVSLERVASAGGYVLGITHEGAEDPRFRRKIPKFCTVNNKPEISPRELVALREIRGDPQDPELIVELAETGEKITVTKDDPFKRVEGYEADLSYPVEDKTYKNLRKNSRIFIGGEEYKIVAITPGEVVLSASLNDKKYNIRQVAPR